MQNDLKDRIAEWNRTKHKGQAQEMMRAINLLALELHETIINRDEIAESAKSWIKGCTELEDELERVKAAAMGLRDKAHHSYHCQMDIETGRPCFCGLDEAIRVFNKAMGG